MHELYGYLSMRSLRSPQNSSGNSSGTMGSYVQMWGRVGRTEKKVNIKSRAAQHRKSSAPFFAIEHNCNRPYLARRLLSVLPAVEYSK
jgi:hypothetical protein